MDEFEEFLDSIGRLFEVPTLTPEALENVAGVKVALEEKHERFLPKNYTVMTYAVVSVFAGVDAGSSKLEHMKDRVVPLRWFSSAGAHGHGKGCARLLGTH
jgi:hypothetical protein